jgi:hypothetical protein
MITGQKVPGSDVSTEKILDGGTPSRAHLIDQVKLRVASDAPPTAEELTECAGGAFERYTRLLLSDLLAESERREGGLESGRDAALKRRFAEGLDEAGAALREAIAQSIHRHTVSQVLQRKMFEAESMLRKALKGRIAEARSIATEAAV